MEDEKRINWLSLFIKIIIIFIFILIIIWLISKIIGGNKLSKTFTNNINNMEKVAVEYFKGIDLPLDKGKSTKITLEELIEKELIMSVNKNDENTCDGKESYSKITREKNRYLVTTTLKCGREKDTIKKVFPLKDCKNCNQDNQNTNNDNNDNNDKEENNNVESPEKVTYYEYVKETTSYTKWMRGNKTGNNIENRYEYYGIDYATYYSLASIEKGQTSVTYTLKLNKVPNSNYYFTTVEEVNNFSSSEEKEYLNEKDISVKESNKLDMPASIGKYSLKENNFTYQLAPYYRKGSFYVRVAINVNNTDGTQSYYDKNTKKDVYLIPLKLKLKFASNKITDTKPEGEYERISYYRYVTVDRETIWSTETSVEGYKKTGNTKSE